MVTAEHDGTLTFRIYVPSAERVDLIGDFTRWTDGAITLKRESETASTALDGMQPRSPSTGWWRVRVRISDGDHAFSYRIDDRWWLPDYAAHGVRRNPDGNWTSLLFVPPRPEIARRRRRYRSWAGRGCLGRDPAIIVRTANPLATRPVPVRGEAQQP